MSELIALDVALLPPPDVSEKAVAISADRDTRLRDVLWVAGYRAKSSLLSFGPHITLGHASQALVIEPFTFEAVTVAVCQLGRFCTCCHVSRQWMLGAKRGDT